MPTPVTYPLDMSGNNPSNFIQNELHSVSESYFRDYFFIIPNMSPFFVDNFFMSVTTNGVTRNLIEDIDFSFVLSDVTGTRTTGKAMYGGVSLHNLDLNGILSVSYQTIGGENVADRLRVLTHLAEKAYNPRTTIFNIIDGVPTAFPPVPHYQDYDQFFGQEEVVNQLHLIRDAILQNSTSTQLAIQNFLASTNILGDYVSKAGDVMSGFLTLHANPLTPLHAATKQYVDNSISNNSNINSHIDNTNIHLTTGEKTLISSISATPIEINRLSGITANIQALIDSKINTSGGTLTGSLILNTDPTQPLEAATKQYVDLKFEELTNMMYEVLAHSSVYQKLFVK